MTWLVCWFGELEKKKKAGLAASRVSGIGSECFFGSGYITWITLSVLDAVQLIALTNAPFEC